MWVTFGSPAYEKSLTVGDQSYSQDLSTIPITHIQCFSKVLYRSHWGGVYKSSDSSDQVCVLLHSNQVCSPQ